ncbi:uncharacterized protein IL334_000864 [Kwoniella shivajii]|uniref:Non-structural maintenance of chromosomes element 1 homolog n=1 Tax=Kwoniella shivajii TaxID=564305 RepID=A0ABZ1CQC8_9TREE|nr:hypothetical protein IL334_000864 [Kwoniella shivajii]
MNQTRYIAPTDLHRVFIQSMLSRRAMRDDVTLEMYKRAVGACQENDGNFRPTHPTTLQGMRSFLIDVSDILHDLGMEVATGQEQSGKGKGWVVLRNIDPSEVALYATDYTPLEIDYYRRVVQGIIESYPANSIAHGQALNLVSELESNMARHVAENLLNSLCSRGWLSKSKRGRYTLGVRAALELEPYLKNQFDDYMQNCKQCKRLMLDGVCCSKDGCEAHFHSYCHSSIMKLPRPSCPNCKSRFSEFEPTPVGEKAVSRAEDEFKSLKKRKRVNGKTNGKGQGKGRASQMNEDDEGTEEEDEDELEEEENAIAEEEQNGSGFIEKAGPSGWRVDASSRRKSVVPETQYDEGTAEGEGEDEIEEESEERPANRRRSRR